MDIGAIIAILSKSEIVNYCVWIYLDSLTYLTMNLFFLSPIVAQGGGVRVAIEDNQDQIHISIHST